jgi:large subunit ribosomal protein L24
MFKFKKGDEIRVISGRDKGKKSKIDKVITKENKIIASGINVYKRHKKVSPNKPAGIYESVRPIDVSKIAIICPKCNKPTKVGFKIEGKTKQRICKKCKGSI